MGFLNKTGACLGILGMLLLTNCQKGIEEVKPDVQNNALAKEESLKKRITETSAILRKIYRDPAVLAEVNAAIGTGYYEDERILLKDLLNPANSPVYRLPKFKELMGNMKNKSGRVATREGAFSAAFRQEIANAGGRVNTDYFVEGGINIYFPYSENFAGDSGPITTVDAVVDADEAQGWRMIYTWAWPDGTLRLDEPEIEWRQVTVNDDYADANPTHIVGAGAEPAAARVTSVNEYRQVFIGWARCSKQYDNFISFTGNGGGSEIRFIRVSGYLKLDTDGQVNGWENVVPHDFSRKEIRKNTWKRVYDIWDADWKEADKEQVLGIYEEDNKGEKKNIRFHFNHAG